MKYSMSFGNMNRSRKAVGGKSFSASSGLPRFNSASSARSNRFKAKSKSNYRKFSELTKGIASPFRRGVSTSSSHPGRAGNRSTRVKKFLRKALTTIVVIGFFGTIFGSLGMGLYLKSLRDQLPDPDKLLSRNVEQSTIIYDRNGVELYKVNDQKTNRVLVKIEDIPEHTKWALLAAEDVEFYQHKGLDLKGILGCAVAGVQNYLSGGTKGGLCGASTISQQLVRNTLLYEYLGDEAFTRGTSSPVDFYKTVRRKIMEWLLTMQVERTFSKDEILQLYMNEIGLGGINYGYEAASQAYFGKSVKELNLSESALIAGLIQSPGVYSPLFGSTPELANVRQDYVLNQMWKYRELTGVTQEQIDEARGYELVYSPAQIDIEGYHFVFYVRQLLEDQFGKDLVEKGGLRVTTTLDLSTQEIAEEELKKGIETFGRKENVWNGAMLVVDPNSGQILAMVGSIDPNETQDRRIDGNVNITTSKRQVGSSFKPYVYFTNFQKYGPWYEAPDLAEFRFGNYDPDNWDGRFYGPMTARQGLIQSRNVPAVYSLQLAGIENVIKNVEKMGITSLNEPDKYGLSMVLGTAEMTMIEQAQGFTVFATGGIKRNVTPILKVTNNKGEVLSEFKDAPERIFDEKDVYLLNWVLCDIGGFGDQPLNRNYLIGGKRALCGKTGTTNGPKDLVSVQYHKNLVSVIWAGNNNGETASPNAWSTTVPLPINHSFMERVASKYKPEGYSRPAGVLSGLVCNDSGRSADKDTPCAKVPTVYVQGRAPEQDKRRTVYICNATGKEASNTQQAKQYGLGVERPLLDFTLENPIQQNAYELYLSVKGVLLKDPGKEECKLPLGPGDAPVVQITSPSNGTSVTVGQDISATATAWAQESVASVQFLFNGNPVETDSEAPYSISFKVPSVPASGNYALSAKVTDNKGRTSTESINLNVTVPQQSLSISITDPTNGSSFKLPKSLNASVSNGSADSVTFVITKKSDNSQSTLTATAGNGGNWSATMLPALYPVGEYTIQARAVKGQQIYSSAVISVTVKLN